MRIAVDVMGGDHGCGVVIKGARKALESLDCIRELLLVGREEAIRSELSAAELTDPRLKIFHASEVLTMEDKPVLGLRRKKDCSILKAINAVKNGEADAVVSPGNTGAVVAAATIRLRQLQGVERPGIATTIPTEHSHFIVLDSGANVDSRPINLAHYAIMGSVYCEQVMGIKNPKVGLLSVGTEESKGNELTLAAFPLCELAGVNFIGNIEGHDLFEENVDVVICDGFVGNIVLKTCESMAKGVFGWLKREMLKSPVRKIGALLSKGAFKPLKLKMNPDAYGGAPLLGVNGNVMITHGSAGETAIFNAIRVATETVQNNINGLTLEQIEAFNLRVKVNKN